MNKDDLKVYLLFFLLLTSGILLLFAQGKGYIPNNFAEVSMEYYKYSPHRRYGL